jgi:transposase-like protein
MPLQQKELKTTLPLPGERWVPRRKAMVVEALRNGEITIEELCLRYELSPAELASWIDAFEQYGEPGLRATRFQIYREVELQKQSAALNHRTHPGSAMQRSTR